MTEWIVSLSSCSCRPFRRSPASQPPGRSFAGRGSGVADDQKPPVEFGPDKNVKWKVAGAERRCPRRSSWATSSSHGVRRRQALHDRLQPRRRQRSLAGRRAGRDRSSPTSRPKAARPRRRRRPTASGSSRTSARAGCSATTSPARNCGSSRCRRRPRSADFGTGVSPIIADGVGRSCCATKEGSEDHRARRGDRRTSSGRRSASRRLGSARRSCGTRPAGKQIVARRATAR